MKQKSKSSRASKEKNNAPGYPVYPPGDDIYKKSKEEQEINPEDITTKKTPNEEPGTLNEKDFSDEVTGEDLDIPDNESDEKEIAAGDEDEENNYYSLGGDDHNDLEEDAI